MAVRPFRTAYPCLRRRNSDLVFPDLSKRLDPHLAVIEVPNKFVAHWLREKYIEKIKDSIHFILHVKPEIYFISSSSLVDFHGDRETNPKSGLSSFCDGLDPLFTFDNFIPCAANRLAHSLCLEIAKSIDTTYSPLYLFSRFSAGKTHLLQAIAHALIPIVPNNSVRYITTANFSSLFFAATRGHSLNDFREDFYRMEILLLDDIQYICDRRSVQREMVTLLDHYRNKGTRFVVSSNMPPAKLRDLIDPFSSRLQSGPLVEIHLPDPSTKVDILRKKARHYGLDLPDDVAFFLSNSASDLKTLIDHLQILFSYCSTYGRQVDLVTVQSLLQDKPARAFRIEDIQRLTAIHFDLSLSEILSTNRSRRYSYPRQVAIYLCRKLTHFSYKEIGRAFGNRDHSSILIATKTN